MLNIKAIIKNYIRKIKTNFYAPNSKPEKPEIKRAIIKSYANSQKKPLNIFIETGTYKGDTVNYLKDTFTQIHSIELDQTLYEENLKRFSNLKNIKIYHGDSSLILKDLIKNITEPCLFWLDGHYSGGETAKAKNESPILKELNHISNHSVKNHTILIDDARKFIGYDGYPTLKKLKKIILTKFPEHKINIEKDIIRITPNEN